MKGMKGIKKNKKFPLHLFIMLMKMQYEELTGKILATCFEVSNELGCGFLESVYQKALIIALKEKDLKVEPEHGLEVIFHGQNVGQFYADLLVENKVMIELKAVSVLDENHKAQIINYLKASGIEVGLLVNFGAPKLEYRRFNNRFIEEKKV
jgi:GxxExxY protein